MRVAHDRRIGTKWLKLGSNANTIFVSFGRNFDTGRKNSRSTSFLNEVSCKCQKQYLIVST